ncbi:MAG: translation initiation factor [Myxococcales bacterium]|nr:translation initiation factor [Myxococcales bacterium]MBK7191069.1 translation initiation factor [Myxococcales bacterium]
MTGKKDSGFAGLAGLRDQLPSAPAPAAPTAPPVPPAPKGPARAVVRLERKGRGGKEATVIEKLDLAPAALATWCKDLKSALGCGGVVEGDAIVLQGDLRPRLEAVLTKRGVRKVTIAG